MNTALTTSVDFPKWRIISLLLAGNLLLAISSKISLPLLPVPVTLQSFAVLLIAMLYGARLGTATVSLFILEGLCGLPVLAIGSWATLGYALGFIPAAWICGYLAEWGWNMTLPKVGLVSLLGIGIIMACGLSQLFLTLKDWSITYNIGLKPFILGEGLKVILLSIMVPGSQGLLKRFHP
jgi:biotin transport system substrate-specific component